MLFYLFLGAIVFIFFKVLRGTVKYLDRVFNDSPTRLVIWKWTNGILFVGVSIPLLFLAFRQWHYFHDEMVYSGNKKQLNQAYADQIDVKTYLMSQQNVIDLFKGNPPNPNTQTIQDKGETFFYNVQNPSDPRYYLVVELKNKGNKVCWGILENYADGKKVHNIDIPPLSPEMKEPKYIVIRAWPSEQKMPGDYPHLEAKWLKLYTSKGEKS